MRIITLTAVAIALSYSHVGGSVAAPASMVHRSGERLSVEFNREQARDAFKALEEKAAVTLRGSLLRPDTRLTLSFDDEPVEEGVRRILQHLSITSYALVRKSDERGTLEVVLLGTAAVSTPATPIAEPAPRLRSRSDRVVGTDDLMERAVAHLGDGHAIASVDEDALQLSE